MASIPLSDPVDPAPDPLADFAAAAEKRESERSASALKKNTPKASQETDTAATDAVAAVPAKKAVEADTPTTAPADDEPAGLSFLPENLRSKVPTLSPELKAWMKEQAAYEKRYKDLQAHDTKQSQSLVAAEEKASRWDALLKDPDAAKAAMDAMERKRQGKPAVEEDDGWDFTEHSAQDNKAYIREMIAKVSGDVAEARAEAVVERKVLAPQKTQSALGAAIAKWAEENSVAEEDGVRIIALAKPIAQDLGIKWAPENAARLMDLGRLMLPAAPKNTHAAKNGNAGLARVASPSARGVGLSAPKVPAWKAAGLKWPKTADEKADYFADLDVGDVPASE